MLTLTRLVAPPRSTGRLTTVHSPAVEIVPIWSLLQSGDSVLEIEYKDAEAGALVHAAAIVPASGGVVVMDGQARTHVPVVVRAQQSGAVIELGCPVRSSTRTSLYLLSAGSDGQTLKPGPRCRRCAGLVPGSERLLTGRYARQMLISWLDRVGNHASEPSSATQGS